MIARTLAQQWAHIGLTNLGLILFFTMFCFLAFGIFRTANRQALEKESRLPLEDDARIGGSHV